MRLRKAVLWAPMVATGALLLLPQSGWLVRSQVRGMFGQSNTPVMRFLTGTADATPAAVSLPDDIGVQMAVALRNARPNAHQNDGDAPQPDERVDALLALRTRYSNQPALYGNILRYMTQRLVIIGRQDEQEILTKGPNPVAQTSLTHQDVSKPSRTNPNINRPESLALFEECAQKGMELDRDNAYFPLMLAVGRYAARRDDEAMAAMEVAASKPAWREYYAEETRGQWELAKRQYGEPGGIARTAVAAAVLFPHYAQFRSAARLATLDAMNADMVFASPAEGLRRRQTVMNVGMRMRMGATSLIGNLVGAAIEQTAMERPGGALPIKTVGNDTNGKALAAARRQAFRDYLVKVGHTEQVDHVNSEMATIDQVKDISRRGLDHGVFDMDYLFGLVALQGVGGILLYVALWMLIVGAVAVRLSGLRTVQERQPLSPSVRAGLLTAVCGSLILGAGSLAVTTINETLTGMLPVLLPVAGATIIGIACAWLRWRTTERKPLVPFFAALMVGLFGVASIVWGLLSQVGLWQMGNALAGCFSSESDSGRATLFNPVLLGMGASLLVALVPLFLFLTVGLQSRRKRVPVGAGAVHGFRRAAVPVAALLLTAYIGVLAATLQREAQTRAGLEAMLTHEGRYLAGLIGAEWPGETHR